MAERNMDKGMRIIMEKLENHLNDYRLKKKLQMLYIFCVLFPLVVTDGVILYDLIRLERQRQQYEMENVASAVQYNLSNTVEHSAATAKNIYLNRYIENFLNVQFGSALDYVMGRQRFMKDTLFESSLGMDNTKLTMYADNETIVNGGEFSRISAARGTGWYERLQESGEDMLFLFYYDDGKSPAVDGKRKLLFLRKMNFFHNSPCEKVLKIEMDYSNMVRDLERMHYEQPVYICRDGEILLSNEGHNSVLQNFEGFTDVDRVGFEKEITLYGEKLQIYVLKTPGSILPFLRENIILIGPLLLVNIILPWFLMRQIDRSITVRIGELSRVFESVGKDRMTELSRVRGKDEIGSLMLNYNRMAVRMNDLIQTVYKDKLKEQEMDIARQSAELLALRSQINPHFLFNALESIRMHSILKGEYETADMVEKLAVMERQNVDWGVDDVEIGKEMEFVEAYLGLQKYRFGDRLSYELSVAPDCVAVRIPKLTLVTFVENACVHGIESKTAPGWIFVRIYKENGILCIEVEDTGDGMEEDALADILDKMRNASIDRLREKGRVGILNACLRLKMMPACKADFHIESEKGTGTMIQIRISPEMLSEPGGGENGHA